MPATSPGKPGGPTMAEIPTRDASVKRALVLLLVVLAAVCAFAWQRRTRQRLLVSARELTLPADGALHRAIAGRVSRVGRIAAGAIATAGLSASVLPEGDAQIAAAVEVRSPVNPGTQRLVLRYRAHSVSVTVHFAADRDRKS